MRVRWNRVSAVAIARRVTVIASLVLVSTLAVGAPVFAAEEGGSLVVLPTVAGFLFALYLALAESFV